MANRRTYCALTILGLAAFTRAGAGTGSAIKPPADPARIEIQVAPSTAPGQEQVVTVRLAPAEGVQINRYPKMRLKLDPQKGLTSRAEIAVGSDAPPPPDRIDQNYYDKIVDPIQLPLRLDPAAGKGPFELQGQLTYYYCVKASGFCAPKKVPVTIPISAR